MTLALLVFAVLTAFADHEFRRLTRKGPNLVLDMVGTTAQSAVIAGEAVILRERPNVARVVRSLMLLTPRQKRA